MELDKVNIDLAHSNMNVTILREKMELLQSELNNVRLEKKNLDLLNLQLSQPSQRLATKSVNLFITKLTKSMDRKYISLASAVERELYEWAHAETMEIKQTEDPVKTRNWTGRMTIVQEYGIPSTSTSVMDSENPNVQFVPIVITSVLNSTDVFYIRSFDSYSTILQSILEILLQQSTWSAFAPNSQLKSTTISVISSSPVMIGKLKQCLSDAISNRKRLVRDEFFQSLRYFSLKSSHDRRKETPLFEKTEEISLARQKILGQEPASNTSHDRQPIKDYSRWRIMLLQDLTSDGVVPDHYNNNDIKVERPELLNNYSDEGDDSGSPSENKTQHPFQKTCLGLFLNPVSTQLMNLFMGFDPYTDEDNVSETSIVALTRLDAWIATVVQLLVPMEKRGGGRQRDYNHFFHQNHRCAMHQLIHYIYDFVKYWEPGELAVDQDAPDNDYRGSICDMDRTATRILYYALHETYYIAVRSEWFSTYISSCLGTVHDCYIAKISNDWTSIAPLDLADVPTSDTGKEKYAQEVTQGSNFHNTGTHPNPFREPTFEDRTDYEEDDDGLNDVSPDTVTALNA